MSKNFIDNKAFLELLLSTSKKQAVSLLQTTTKEQLLLLSEIFFNILNLPLPKTARQYVTKKKKLIQRLASKKTNKSQKLSLIKKHSRFLQQLLFVLKRQLNELL